MIHKNRFIDDVAKGIFYKFVDGDHQKDPLTITQAIDSVAEREVIEELKEQRMLEFREELRQRLETEIRPNYEQRRENLLAEIEEINEQKLRFDSILSEIKKAPFPFGNIFKNPFKRLVVYWTWEQKVAYVTELRVQYNKKVNELRDLDAHWAQVEKIIGSLS